VLRLLFPYFLFVALAFLVARDRLFGGHDLVAAGPGAEVMVEASAEVAVARDPVCNMEVDGRLGAVLEGRSWYFCSNRCRERFLADPGRYAADSCPVCRVETGEPVPVGADSPAWTWNGRTWRFCGEEHRRAFAADPAGYFMHTMWGIPGWLYGGSVALVLVLSFGLFELFARLRRRRGGEVAPRADLFRARWLAALLRWPPFRFLCQLPFVLLFVLVILAGLFGNQIAAANIAPILTWTIWWGGLVILILFAGKAWCYVCPWNAIADWIERLSFWRKKEGTSLGLPWPRILRNIWLATFFFVGLTWLEIGFGVTLNPRATALLGLLMLTLAVVSALVFERRGFCRYACLVGRVSGLYALFSASELRPRDAAVCRSCRGRECYHGSARGYGCPTGVFPGGLRENTYCITCMECVKTCPEDNLTLRARPWGADLEGQGRGRRDEAYLALLMLAITGFHGLTMTRAWRDILGWLQDGLGLPYMLAFSLGMAGIMLGPVLVYALLVRLAVHLAGPAPVGYRQAFVRFAYSVLPIALFYHLAHNAEHLLMEGQKVLPLLSNPFGFLPGENWSILGFQGTGPWNLFGTADCQLPPLASLADLWLVQVILVLVGHLYSLWIADRTARRLYSAPGAAFRSQLPMLAGMVLFSIFSLWLLKQPMEMRISAM